MIHITLGTMPTLLRGIVRSALQSQQDFAVNDAAHPGPSMPASAEQCDILLVCARQGPAARITFQHLLRANPVTIVLLEPDGDHAAVLRLDRDDCALDAPGDLFRVIRAAAAQRPSGQMH